MTVRDDSADNIYGLATNRQLTARILSEWPTIRSEFAVCQIRAYAV
jgi:hypothetical protein